MEVSVLNKEGQALPRKVQLEDSVFNIEPNQHAVYLDVRLYLANQRLGTHKTKERGEVSGTTKKPYRQKGTGNARAGHMRSPLMRHGGTIFGPKPHLYGFKLNKKLKRLARRSALSYKLKENALLVVENLNFESPKTKPFIQVLEKLNLNEKKTLIVTANYDDNVYQSSRNLPKVKVVNVAELNTYDIVNADQLVITEGSVAKINETLVV